MFKQIIISVFIGLGSLINAQINVVVSIVPQQTFVEKIGGDKVHITTMVMPGSNPHSYEPKPSQMKALSNAQIYFPIKIEFEKAWLDRFTQHNKNMKLIDITEGIPFIKMAKHSHKHSDKKNFKSIKNKPYEWAGVFEVNKGRYTWSFSKVAGNYAHASMKFLIIPILEDKKDSIESYENLAQKLFDTGTTSVAKDGETLNASGGLYTLQFNENLDQTDFDLEMKKDGKYLFFTQYVPMKFEDKQHFFKDNEKHDIEPVQTKPKTELGLDPHTWTSPSNVKIMAKNILKALVDMDKDNEAYYRKNYQIFLQEIKQTDERIKKIFLLLPKNTNFMVFHPSWGYFANEYGLKQLPIQVEGKEPKLKMLQEIIKKARKTKVRAIFTQKEFSDKSAKVIAAELNIKVLKETPLARNWSENLIEMAEAIANN